MNRKRKSAVSAIVSMAESEGLSYGKYAAREHEVKAQRRPHVLDTVKPRGMSTIQAALYYDCPRLCEKISAKTRNIGDAPKELNPFANTPDNELNEAARLYKQGCSVKEIAKKLGISRRDVIEKLRCEEFKNDSGKRAPEKDNHSK